METSPKSAMQSVDIVMQIIRRIDSPRDLRSASAVCRTWRSAANDPSQLRSWTLDDPMTTAEGAKVSVIPMLPKTPQPRHWINPAVDSPLASFKTPRSLRPLSFPSITEAVESGSGDGESPRTPSPLQQPPAQTGNFKLAVTHKMVMGRFLGDVDICSSHLSDECLQIITRNCPRLHTLRLLHICAAQQHHLMMPFSIQTELSWSLLKMEVTFLHHVCAAPSLKKDFWTLAGIVQILCQSHLSSSILF